MEYFRAKIRERNSLLCLNLLAKDVANQESLSVILKNCTAIAREIKKSHLLLAAFNQFQAAAETDNHVSLK